MATSSQATGRCSRSELRVSEVSFRHRGAGLNDYRYGYSASEFERLREQHRVWLPSTLEHLQAGNIGSDDVVLDLGCGPGFVATEMAQSAARVLAFDRDLGSLEVLRTRCEEAGIENVTTLPAGNVLELPELPVQPTAAYMRWLLCYLGAAGTEKLFRTLADRLTAGGRLLVHDYINYRSVHLEPSSEVFRSVIETFHRDMPDADIGFALPMILQRCGFRIAWKRIVVMAISPADKAWSWPDQFFRIHVPPLPNAEEFLKEWEHAATNHDTVFYSWPVIQLVAVKAG